MSFLNTYSVAINDANPTALSGSIPTSIGKLLSLESGNLGRILLHNTGIIGTLPPEISSSITLNSVLAFNTGLSGQLPMLPESMQLFHLHNCKLTGTLPPMGHLTTLQNFTLQNNNIGGHIELPAQASTMPILLLHNNRLSCKITEQSPLKPPPSPASVTTSTNLVLPGNVISAGLPPWVDLREVTFLYAQSFWVEWQLDIFPVVASLLALPLLLCFGMSREGLARWQQFFVFRPAKSHPVARMEMLAAKLMSACICPWVVVLVPLYVVGSQWLECGKVWLYTTIAYISSGEVEWAIAAASCGFTACAAASINTLNRGLQEWTDEQNSWYAQSHTYSNKQRILTFVLWSAVIAVVSLPQILYVLSTAIAPNENAAHLNGTMLTFSHSFSGFVLFLINAYVLPPAAYRVIQLVRQDVDRASGQPSREDEALAIKLIMAGRFLVALVLPAVFIILFQQDCCSWWVNLWTKCTNDPNSFQYDLAFQTPGAFEIMEKIRIMSHNDICSPTCNDTGKCPRVVVDVLGTLIFRKMLVATFLSPLGTLFILLPQVRSRMHQILHCRCLTKLGYNHEFTHHINREIAGIVMLMEYSFVLGSCVPMLLPLCCVALFLSGAVFNFAYEQKVKLVHDTLPSTEYLWMALLVGNLFVMWLYNAAELQGRWLVTFGVPLMFVISAWYTCPEHTGIRLLLERRGFKCPGLLRAKCLSLSLAQLTSWMLDRPTHDAQHRTVSAPELSNELLADARHSADGNDSRSKTEHSLSDSGTVSDDEPELIAPTGPAAPADGSLVLT